MRRTLLLAIVSVGLVGAAPAEGVNLTVVTYDQLGDAVKRHKGKVVLVDFWFEACLPCKKGFPKVLAMQRKHAERGFVVLTVNVDDPADTPLKESVVAFLGAQKATCANLQLDEKTEIWMAKLGVESLPAVFLFDRRGKLLRKWVDDVDYQQIDDRVAAELAAREE